MYKCQRGCESVSVSGNVKQDVLHALFLWHSALGASEHFRLYSVTQRKSIPVCSLSF